MLHYEGKPTKNAEGSKTGIIMGRIQLWHWTSTSDARNPLVQPASMVTDALFSDSSALFADDTIPEGEKLMANRYIHRSPTKDLRGKGTPSTSMGSNSSTRAPSWMNCFVFHKKGCWSRNHSNEERIAAAKKAPLTKPKLAGAFHVSSSSNDILDLV